MSGCLRSPACTQTHPQREGQGVHEYKTEIRLGEETKRIQPFLTLTAAFWKRRQNFMTFQHQTDAGFGGGVPSIYIYALLAKLQWCILGMWLFTFWELGYLGSVFLVCWVVLRMLVFVCFCPRHNLPKASRENIRKMPRLRRELLNSLLFIEWTLHCVFSNSLFVCARTHACTAFSLDAEQPDYDLDSEDEAFVNRLKKKMEVGVLQFEQMIDRLEKGSGQQVSPSV